jgi:DNA-binding Lrp family transcriptional regulator
LGVEVEKHPKRLSEIGAEELAFDYNMGMSLSELAEKYECSENTVYRRLLDGGVDFRGRDYERMDLPIEDIKSEYLSGASLRELGQRHGVSFMTIRRRLEEAGVSLRKKMPDLDMQEVISDYVEERRGLRAVGKKHGVAETLSVMNKLKLDNSTSWVMDSYTAYLKKWHDYPEREGFDTFEVGIKFNPQPQKNTFKLCEWVPFLPVYVEEGSSDLEVRKAFQQSVEEFKSFDLEVGSEVLTEGGECGIFRVIASTQLAVYGEFVDGFAPIWGLSESAYNSEWFEWVSWASITGVERNG